MSRAYPASSDMPSGLLVVLLGLCSVVRREAQRTWQLTEVRNEVMMSRERSTSLNMPSSLLVNWLPHSALSLVIMVFSASVLLLLPSSSRLARSFL